MQVKNAVRHGYIHTKTVTISNACEDAEMHPQDAMDTLLYVCLDIAGTRLNDTAALEISLAVP